MKPTCQAALLAMFYIACPAPAAVTVASPDGRVQFRLFVSTAGRLEYAVALRATPVIEPSPLGITVDGVNLSEGVRLGRPARYKMAETYPWYGVHSTAVNRCNGVRIPVTHAGTRTAYTLEARAYDDGIAFRNVVPGGARPRTPDEATLFRIPAGSTVWYHDFEGHYEGIHKKKDIRDVASGDWAAPPLTFKLPNGAGYAFITEGALVRYAGLALQGDGQGGFNARLGHSVPPSYPFRLRYKGEEGRMAQPAAIEGTITTPWRVVMAGPDLNALVNCDIVHNVAPPPDPKLFPQGIRTEWVKPGRAVWRYLDGGETTLEGMKEFSRLAGELGFEYHVIEGFWQKWSERDLAGLVEYSRARGVGIWLWKHSRDIRDASARRAFFELCRRVGAVGVKLDFFDHEAKEVVELYEAALRDAAGFKLLVNFHGANKPAGESRTWPNELTREAVRGMESRKSLRARHDATLPFTRLLAGPADYTPMHFGERRNDTTWAHQVASAVVLTSPLLTYAAHPAAILRDRSAAAIKSIPSVWDETVVLPASEIGEVAVIARRRGADWFLAVLNGEAARTLRVPLSFLGSGAYRATFAQDDGEPPPITVTSADALPLELSPGGGHLTRLSR